MDNSNSVCRSYPLVSVVITTYNQKCFLKEAIDSVIMQDYENIEIVVADDCSTDGTDTMMESYKSMSCVKYYRNLVNLGPGNNGCYAFYKYVNGDFILYLNHDDYLTDSSYISEAVNFLLSNPNVSFVYAGCDVLLQHSGEVREMEIDRDEITNGKDYFLNYGYGTYNTVTSVLTSLFRRENAVKMECFKEETKSKDLFLYLKLMLTGDVGFINRSVGVYRVHGESLSYHMPLSYDNSTVSEFKNLKERALSLGFSKKEMDLWMERRIYQYFSWRISMLISQRKMQDVQQLLTGISQEYPNIAHDILTEFK